jgi:hypothetical protein
MKVVGYYLSQDQTPSEDPWDTFSFRSTYSPEAQRVEEGSPEPPAATTNHRPGISDVTTRSKREQQHEQECPATRRCRRRVGASELERLGIGGGEEAQGTSEGRVIRNRGIRAPPVVLQETNCSLLHHVSDHRFPNAAISTASVPQR